MRTLTAILLLVYSSFASAQLPDKRLEKFNSSPPWENSSGEISDNPSLVERFQDKHFVCRNVDNYTPKENAVASRAFSDFVAYASNGDQNDGFWFDAEHRKKRLALLDAAIQAGSWKAIYFDSVWSFLYPIAGDTKEKAYARIVELGKKGWPIVVYKIGSDHGAQDEATYFWLGEAIDRGSPHAMTLVGSTIVTQSKALRPIGKLMLECAASQGHANAYHALGKLADMEGRRLDAYRLWEKGVNEGCEECITPMLRVGRARMYTSGESIKVWAMMFLPQWLVGNMLSSNHPVPELLRIKNFYENNWSYRITELPDFERRLPKHMEFHPSDSELLLTLKLESRMRERLKGWR